MKKIVLIVMALAGALAVQADDYPYLTFETADGTKTSVSSSSLTITIQDGKLIAGSNEFNLTDLSKMYFSTSNETTGIEEVNISTLDEATDIYDLQGRKVNKDQMRRGVYVIKTSQGTRKVNVK
jgi:hypothetical protein